MDDSLPVGACWLLIQVPYAGLDVTEDVQLAEDVSLSQIFPWNLAASVFPDIEDIILRQPRRDDHEPSRPVYGLKYRVLGRTMAECAASEAHSVFDFNEAAANRIEKSFERAIALTFGTKIERVGKFVEELDRNGQRREGPSSFSLMTLGVNFLAAEVCAKNARHLSAWFTYLRLPYFDEEGVSLIVALDRYLSSMSGESPLDVNLDLCIAAEIPQLRSAPISTVCAPLASTAARNYCGATRREEHVVPFKAPETFERYGIDWTRAANTDAERTLREAFLTYETSCGTSGLVTVILLTIVSRRQGAVAEDLQAAADYAEIMLAMQLRKHIDDALAEVHSFLASGGSVWS
jgi:hypothetical protein